MYLLVLQARHTVVLVQTAQSPVASHGVHYLSAVKNVPDLQSLHWFGLPGTHKSHPLTLQSGIHHPTSLVLYPGAQTHVLPSAKP